MTARTSFQRMLALPPRAPRTAAVIAMTAADLCEPAEALRHAQAGLQALAGGQDEPYHAALLHLTAARALMQGGGGSPTFPVAALSEHVQGASAAKAACRGWLPNALKVKLREARARVGVTDDELQAAKQVGA